MPPKKILTQNKKIGLMFTISSLGVLLLIILWNFLTSSNAADVETVDFLALHLIPVAWLFWALITLCGFVILTITNWDKGANIQLSVSTSVFAIYVALVIILVTYQRSISAWAINQKDLYGVLPEIYVILRIWVDMALLPMANQVATLSIVGISSAILKVNIVFKWVGQIVIVFGAILFFFPATQLIFPTLLILGGGLLVFNPKED